MFGPQCYLAQYKAADAAKTLQDNEPTGDSKNPASSKPAEVEAT